jgi:hypothetical protein
MSKTPRKQIDDIIHTIVVENYDHLTDDDLKQAILAAVPLIVEMARDWDAGIFRYKYKDAESIVKALRGE